MQAEITTGRGRISAQMSWDSLRLYVHHTLQVPYFIVVVLILH